MATINLGDCLAIVLQQRLFNDDRQWGSGASDKTYSDEIVEGMITSLRTGVLSTENFTVSAGAGTLFTTYLSR